MKIAKIPHQEQVKLANQLNILRAVRTCETISRSDLARRLNLSAPSISNNVDELIKAHVLIEVGKAESFSGRRPILLTFNENLGYVVAVDMLTYSIQITLSNLSGNKFIDRIYVRDAYTISKETFEEIKDKIEILLKSNHINPDNLLCICFGSPGHIDPKTSHYVYAPRIHDYKNLRIKEDFEKRFNTRVIVKNDVNCATLGEKHYGLAVDEENFLNVYIDYGIGSGMFLENKLYNGSTGASGEIGMLVHDIPGAVFGKAMNYKNSTDANLSLAGLIWKTAELFPEIYEDIKYDVVDKNAIKAHANRMFEYVSRRDERVIGVIRESAGVLAGIVINICVMLDIETVILNGALVQNLGEVYLQWVNDYLRIFNFTKMKLKISSLGSDAVTYGALGESVDAVIMDLLS